MPEGTGPDRISRYEVQGLIARGGMGRIYLARDPNTGRLVAVKLLDATLESSEVRDRFDREAKSLAALSHPSIVHIYDYGDFQESPFIVMEYIRGETLEEKINRRAPIAVNDALRLMSEVCGGLAHAHAAGIVHRDVKPANLMVDQDERLKILDFGIARVSDSSLTRVKTAAGWAQAQIGTPGYMSPEQTHGGPIDHRTDIFAVGAVCYELLALRRAFPGRTLDEIERSVMRTPPEPLAAERPEVVPEVDEILARAMARDPQDRYPDATALQEAFERCRLGLAAATTASAPRRPTPHPNHAAGSPAARADGAYARAMAAYEGKSLDVARRLAIEALAEQPGHAGASALLARLAPARPAPVQRPAAGPPPAPAPRRADMDRPRRNPETISVDPTVLIERADRSKTAEPIEPTIAISRDDVRRRLGGSDAPRNPPPPRRQPAPVSEPTVLVQSPRQPASGSRKAGRPPALPFWLRVQALLGLGGPASPPRSRPSAKAPAARGRGDGAWTPTTRGAVLAMAAVAFAALFLFGVVQFWQWLRPSEQQLTFNRPVGGTIVGGGIDCGSRGSTCTASVRTGDGIELRADPDPGYVLGAFTGDCPATGRLLMTQARTCGATFDRVGTSANDSSASGTQWPLTIIKPTGGSVVFEEILCGSLDDRCTAQIRDGRPVALVVQTDNGHRFVGYTGDCAPSGETTMSGARTCGATFAKLETKELIVDNPPPPRPNRPPPSPPRGNAGTPPPSTPTGGTPSGTPGTTQGAGTPSSGGTTTPPQPTPPKEAPVPIGDGKPAEAPITAEAHAKKDIVALVGSYCAAYSARDADRIRKMYPLVDHRRLREFFREHKSLKCSVTEPSFDRLDVRGKDGSGGAQVKFDMKHVVVMESGGAPKVNEVIVTMRTSRKTNQNDWLIDGVDFESKPKG